VVVPACTPFPPNVVGSDSFTSTTPSLFFTCPARPPTADALLVWSTCTSLAGVCVWKERRTIMTQALLKNTLVGWLLNVAWELARPF
jgi:hypothetical protein